LLGYFSDVALFFFFALYCIKMFHSILIQCCIY
jgi:hypothetical protein